MSETTDITVLSLLSTVRGPVVFTQGAECRIDNVLKQCLFWRLTLGIARL